MVEKVEEVERVEKGEAKLNSSQPS